MIVAEKGSAHAIEMRIGLWSSKVPAIMAAAIGPPPPPGAISLAERFLYFVPALHRSYIQSRLDAVNTEISRTAPWQSCNHCLSHCRQKQPISSILILLGNQSTTPYGPCSPDSTQQPSRRSISRENLAVEIVEIQTHNTLQYDGSVCQMAWYCSLQRGNSGYCCTYRRQGSPNVWDHAS